MRNKKIKLTSFSIIFLSFLSIVPLSISLNNKNNSFDNSYKNNEVNTRTNTSDYSSEEIRGDKGTTGEFLYKVKDHKFYPIITLFFPDDDIEIVSNSSYIKITDVDTNVKENLIPDKDFKYNTYEEDDDDEKTRVEYKKNFDISALNLNDELEVEFYALTDDNEIIKEVFSFNKAIVNPAIDSIVVNRDYTLLSGSIVTSNSNGLTLAGGTVTATPTDGGTLINGYIRDFDQTFLISNLAPDTEYELKIKLNFLRPNGTFVETNEFSETHSTIIERKINNFFVSSFTHDSAILKFDISTNDPIDKIELWNYDVYLKDLSETNFTTNNLYATTISDLDPSTSYNFQLKVKGSSEIVSTYVNFETLPRPVIDQDHYASSLTTLTTDNSSLSYFTFINGIGTGDVKNYSSELVSSTDPSDTHSLSNIPLIEGINVISYTGLKGDTLYNGKLTISNQEYNFTLTTKADNLERFEWISVNKKETWVDINLKFTDPSATIDNFSWKLFKGTDTSGSGIIHDQATMVLNTNFNKVTIGKTGTPLIANQVYTFVATAGTKTIKIEFTTSEKTEAMLADVTTLTKTQSSVKLLISINDESDTSWTDRRINFSLEEVGGSTSNLNHILEMNKSSFIFDINNLKTETSYKLTTSLTNSTPEIVVNFDTLDFDLNDAEVSDVTVIDSTSVGIDFRGNLNPFLTSVRYTFDNVNWVNVKTPESGWKEGVNIISDIKVPSGKTISDIIFDVYPVDKIPSQDEVSTSNGKLSTSSWIAIISGSVLGALILGLIGYYFGKNRKTKSDSKGIKNITDTLLNGQF